MTGDHAQIEKVLDKVDHLVVNIETTRFDPFQPTHRQDWKNSMGWFQREVELIEAEATRYVYMYLKWDPIVSVSAYKLMGGST